MVFAKATTQDAAKKKAVGKKVLHIADYCRSRSRSSNGGILEYHTTPSDGHSTLAHASVCSNQVIRVGSDQSRRVTSYLSTVRFHMELEHKCLLGNAIPHADLMWPSDDVAVTHSHTRDLTKMPWTQNRFWDAEEQEEWTVERVQFHQDGIHGKGRGKVSVALPRQIPAHEPPVGQTTTFHCCGDERGMFLSHGNGDLFLQKGNRGAGEMWVITRTMTKGVFTIQCCGGEQGLCLEHSSGHLQMMVNDCGRAG